jgi:hypothetical protein
MLDEADERWIAEHGFLAGNPLLKNSNRGGPAVCPAARRRTPRAREAATS